MLLTLRSQVRIVEHGAFEFDVLAHRDLEDSDRACERADFVATIAEWNGDSGVSGGNGLSHACNGRDRPGYAACNDRDPCERQGDGTACEDGQQQRGIVNAFVNSSVNPASSVAVLLAERDQIFTEGVANLSRLIFGGPSRAALGPDCFTIGASLYRES